MSRSDLDTVQARQDAVNRGDSAAVRATTTDCVEVAGPRGTATMAAEDLGAWMTRSGFTVTALRRFCGAGGTVVVEQDAAWHDSATGPRSGRAVVATRFRVVGGLVASLARHDTLAAAMDDAGLTTDDEVVAPI